MATRTIVSNEDAEVSISDETFTFEQIVDFCKERNVYFFLVKCMDEYHFVFHVASSTVYFPKDPPKSLNYVEPSVHQTFNDFTNMNIIIAKHGGLHGFSTL